MKITVVALGKIGLPLAVQFASRGHQVIGTDINQRTVDQVNMGKEPFPGETDLASGLADAVSSGLLTASTDTAHAVAQSEVVVVVVPLFVNQHDQPDFGWLDSATAEIGRGLKSGTLVLFETTLPVGTTRDRWRPLLERASGLVEGQDFHLAFSPERVFTGRIFADLRRYPKLVGGLSDAGAKRAIAFYEAVLEFDDRPDLRGGNGVWDLGSAEAAEMAKLAETTFRDVNIGLANQFAMFAFDHGIDIYRVIEASNSQPYSHIHQPGIAVGGHCIPVYPRLYLWRDEQATIVRAAREVNAQMPQYVASMIRGICGSISGVNVVVLGASYRGGVKETAFSGAFPIVEALQAEGAFVQVDDPMYSSTELTALGLVPYETGGWAEVIVVQADHADYRELSAGDFPGLKLAVDGRRILQPGRFEGVDLVVIGNGAIERSQSFRPHREAPTRASTAAE